VQGKNKLDIEVRSLLAENRTSDTLIVPDTFLKSKYNTIILRTNNYIAGGTEIVEEIIEQNYGKTSSRSLLSTHLQTC